MTKFLIFNLYGPFASWGDIAVGESRPTFMQPTKSAIIGLVSAALGIKRDEEEKLEKLSSSLGFAVCIEAAGTLLRDFHTAQVPSASKIKYYTRKDELDAKSLNTILSTRDYRMDAFYKICLWDKKTTSEYSPESFKNALLNPKFTLYLGRKSCALGIPLMPSVIEAESIKQAFDAYQGNNSEYLSDRISFIKKKEKISGYYWETDSDISSGFESLEIHEIVRRDIPLNRKRWQFEERSESYCAIPIEAKEEENVLQ